MIIKASKIDKVTPDDSVFELHAGYEDEEFDATGMFGTEE